MINCPHYQPLPNSKHCTSYLASGGCKRPDYFMCVEWMAKNHPGAPVFKNQYLSYSRIQLYAQCPQAFRWRYVDKRKSTRTAPQLAFGKLVHEVLELVAHHHVQEELSTPFDLNLALRLYQQAWEASWLTGAELYDEGTRQLRTAIREKGVVEHWDILGIERGFELPAGRFKIIGYIDLVERLPNNTILVTDYKTGALPLPWDVDSTLQLTLYDIAVRRLWPWVRDVKLQLHQTRQGICLETSRTDEQRQSALDYMVAMGARTEANITWDATPGDRCRYCDWSGSCEQYQELLGSEKSHGETLDDQALEYQGLIAKKTATSKRMKEIEAVLRLALSDEEEIKAGGSRWSLYPVETSIYPVERIVDALNNAGLDGSSILSVDKDKLRRVLGKIENPARRNLLKLELEAMASKRIYPRLWCKS